MHASAPPSVPQVDSPVVVLDTNVLLDWLVFDDAHAAPWATALLAGRIRWLATEPMQEEFQRVLSYEPLAARLQHRPAAENAWARLANLIPPPAAGPLICGDPDDQKFIDLAVAHKAKWLLTKDRELLHLARRAVAFGVRVLPPAQWSES